MELSKRLRENPMNSPLKFIGRLFELRDAAHVEHLKTRSFAAHSALNTFYDELLELADGFVESYQGKHGIVNIDIKYTKPDNFLSYLEEFAKYVESSRDVFKDEYLKNQVDEITSLTYSTIYKLTYLK
jgi:glycerophosphoryl diester phosphodiesterase